MLIKKVVLYLICIVNTTRKKSNIIALEVKSAKILGKSGNHLLLIIIH